MNFVNRKLKLTSNRFSNEDHIMNHHYIASLSRLFLSFRQADRCFKSPVMAISLLLAMSFSLVSGSANAYISSDADRSSCRLDETAGRTPPEFTIRGFAAYKNYLEDSATVEVDKIMDRLGELIKQKAKIHSIEIVGHASKYGTSDFLATSKSRAEVVEAEIKSSLITQVPDFNEDLIPFNTYGVSIYCPIDDNRTQAARARNRRVEVWIHYSAAPKKKTVRLKRLLKYVANNSEVKATSCMARKLLKDNYDHSYISRNTIEAVFEEKLSGDSLMNFLDYKLDLKDLAKAKRKRMIAVPPAKGQSVKGVFSKFMENHRRDLVKAITIDLTLKQCDDARMHAMRKHVRERLSKKKKSFYSCPTIKAHVEKMYSDNNYSYRGCGKGY